MGTVYLAEHAVMGWPAAVKVLRRALADDATVVKRFINEARVIRSVRHPNIVEILDAGTLPPPDDRPYLLMELLEGETLGQRLERQGRLPVEMAVDIACQTARALSVAHEKGITHRDLKPDNLFLVTDGQQGNGGGRYKVKVLDFGIAKLRDRERFGSAHTRSGVLLGTPAYMSPEQCRGITEAVDHRADVYALAVVLYQMLTGEVPFAGAGTGDVLIKHVSTEAPRVGATIPGVPFAVDAAVFRGMAKAREDRFQSMAELVEALAPSRVPEPAVKPAPASRLSRWRKTTLGAVGAGGLVAAIAAGVALGGGGSRKRPDLPAHPAPATTRVVDLGRAAAAPVAAPSPSIVRPIQQDPVPAAPAAEVPPPTRVMTVPPVAKPARAKRGNHSSTPERVPPPKPIYKAKPWL
jgi:serine/threonine-protein kinase